MTEKRTPAPQEPAEPVAWIRVLRNDVRIVRFDVGHAINDYPDGTPLYTQSVADAQDAGRWVPVSQSPATGAYLTMNNHGQCGVCHYSSHLEAWSTHFGEDVTHWMPLPAPPAMALDVTKRDPKGG